MEEIIVLDTHNDNPPDNDNWHTDVTFIDTPPAGAILAAKELPTTGGDTLWTSGIAAREALSEPFRQLLSGLHAEHDFRKSFREYKYNHTEAEHRRWQEGVAKHPPLLHPVVRTHPVTGKQALFVNEGFTTRIVDVTEKESAALLSFLFAHITKPEFQVRWRWQPNDVAIWDNRVTQHYANADYLPQRRIMHRATILAISRITGRGKACISREPRRKADAALPAASRRRRLTRLFRATEPSETVNRSPAKAQRAASREKRLCRFLRTQMRANIALIAIGLQVGEIHQHQTIHAVIEIRIAAEIDKLHSARLAHFRVLLIQRRDRAAEIAQQGLQPGQSSL